MGLFDAKYTTTKFFSKFSATYVENATWAKSEILNNIVIDIVASKQPWSMVDLGAGNGELLSLFPEMRNRIGIDLSYEMLAMINDASINRILGDIHSIPLQNSSVDFVVCRQVLHYCQASIVLQETNRILKPDGHVLIIQMTDFDSIPAEWYAKWKTFKQIRERKHLTHSAIVTSAAAANLKIELQRRCRVKVELDWSDVYRKYAALTRRQQNSISTFFRETPESIAKPMRLKVDNKGISYRRGFAFLLLTRADQCLNEV